MLEIARAGEDLWDRAWKRLREDQRDVFARRGYYEAFSKETSAVQAECAIFRDSRGMILHPYFRCSLARFPWLGAPDGGFDLTSAYGYGGFFGETHDRGLFSDFIAAFNDYCGRTGVVAELVRINPILEPGVPLEDHFIIHPANRQVIVELQRSDEVIWRNYRHNNRKNVNKAMRSGVTVVREEIGGSRFGDFLDIYAVTMSRRSAKEAFLFEDGFYRKLDAGLSGKTHVFYSLLDGVTVSAELVLCSETVVYSFLGGTREDFFEFRPNNLLKHEIIKWARDCGYARFLLGGGPGGDDGIFEYKKSFAPEGVVEFHLASRIYNREIFQDLTETCLKHPPHSLEAASAYPLRWRFSHGELH